MADRMPMAATPSKLTNGTDSISEDPNGKMPLGSAVAIASGSINPMASLLAGSSYMTTKARRVPGAAEEI
jgi:hypothetical protein